MKTPPEFFREWLGRRPMDARVALVIDSDRLLAEAGVLDRPMVDPEGREWHLATFRGDDLAFRLRFREATNKGRTVIVLTRGAETEQRIDVSTVADLLGRNEAGTPLNLSLSAYFQNVFPKIHFPITELRQFKDELLDRIEHVPSAAAKLIARWGKPDSWGRAEVTAMVLLAHHPELTLPDVWLNETIPEEFLAHLIQLTIANQRLRPQLRIVRLLAKEVARDQVQNTRFWIDLEPEEVAAYLVLRDFASKAKLQNPSTQLAGLHIFPAEMPLAELEHSVDPLLKRLKTQPAIWAGVQRVAESFLTPARAAKTQVLLKHVVSTDISDLCPAVLHRVLASRLSSFFDQPNVKALSWLESFRTNPLVEVPDPSERGLQCRAALKLAFMVERLEKRLAETVPIFPYADALLSWFLDHEHHVLELEVAQTVHHLEAVDDDELLSTGMTYLGDELEPAPTSLKGRVLARLTYLDEQLAEFIRSSPEEFMHGAHNIRTFIREKLNVTGIQLGSADGRVWVLIFDGMRFDTWEQVVKPVLAEAFEVTESARFGLLPSYTAYARTGILAGQLPAEWKGFKGEFQSDEEQLFAVNLGLSAPEAKAKVHFVKEADTRKARAKWAFSDADVKAVNVLIYPISDDECHSFQGNLAGFNHQIRMKMLGDKMTGVRGILDDLLRRIQPQDTVVLTSDHGFVELLPNSAIPVTQTEAAKAGGDLKAVKWRHVEGFAPQGLPSAVPVSLPGGQVWMSVGRRWFRRQDAPASVRYGHGGVSLAELVIPGVVLRRVTEKVARIEIEDLPGVLSLEEDSVVELSFALRNSGNCDVEFALEVTSNLGEVLFKQTGKLVAAARHPVTAKVDGKYRETSAREPDPAGTLRAITVRLRHTNMNGKWRDALEGPETIPAKVNPKKTKLEADALKGFDDL
jgi:hypothetical protein